MSVVRALGRLPTALSFIEVSPCRTCSLVQQRGTVSRRGVPPDFLHAAAAVAAAAWLLSEPEIIPYSATGGHSHYADSRRRRRVHGPPPENMKERRASASVVRALLHDISFDLEFGRTDRLCWHSCVSVGLAGQNSNRCPPFASRACAAPRGSCRVRVVRPSVRPSIWPIEATSATKHLTFSRSIVELYRKRRNKFLGSPPTTAAAATATSSSPRISPISARRSKVNEIAKLNRKGSAVRGVFDGGWKRAERAGIFFSEGIIKWAGNYCFPSLFLVQP